MTRRIAAALAGFILLLAGCSTVHVSQDYRDDLNFSWYRTYDWQSPDSPQATGNIRLDNPLLHERFREAIDRSLALRGYARQKQSDFLVDYSYAVETRVETIPYGPRFGYSFSRRYRYHDIGFGNYYTEINQYEVGILAISFYDSPSGKLIWRGIGSERVEMHATPQEITAFVDRLVTAVLSQFPPR